MKNFLIRLIGIIFSVIAFFVILSASIETVVYNLTYFEWHYTQRNIDVDTDMSISDLMNVTEKMVDYLKNDRDTLDMKVPINGKMQEVFGEREKLHMVDVKKMAVGMHQFEVFGAILIFLSVIIIILLRKKSLIPILNSVRFVFAALMLLIGILGIMLATNFDKYFTIFHKLFFDNDLWLLDPNTDILINMVPQIFFFTTAMLVILVFVIYVVIFIFAIGFIKKKMLRKHG